MMNLKKLHKSRLSVVRQALTILLLLLAVALAGVVLRVHHINHVNRQAVIRTVEYRINQAPLPARGMSPQFGVYIDGAQMAQDVDNTIGSNNLDIIGIFEHWGPEGVSSEKKLESACKGGYTPLISWESWGGKNSQVVYELKDITQGKYDRLVLNYFEELRRICKDTNIIIRFDHEMEMRPSYGFPWTPWQGKPDEYVSAWRHVINLARNSGFNNLKWLWSPNRADQYIIDYYPGTDYVDYVGMTLNHPTVTGPVYGSFEQFYTPNKGILESFHKPIIVGEAAYYNVDEDRIAAWIQGAFDYVKRDQNIVALVWFNHGLGHLNYSIEATEAGKQAFRHSMSLQP